MQFRVLMTNEVYDTVMTLMKHNAEINDGNEIGGWLCGNWQIDNNIATLRLDRFTIPKQKVSRTEVDISPESMISTLNELGVDESNRIKAHWHIHPFGTGETNWSGGDEDKIKDFMLPDKNRETFVFLLSSLDWIKARVELRMKTTLFGQPQNMWQSIDNLKVERETIPDTESPYLAHLKEQISQKVEVEKWENKYPISNSNSFKDWEAEYKTAKTQEKQWEMFTTNGRVHLKMSNELAKLVDLYAGETVILGYPSKIKQHRNSNLQTWKYFVDQVDASFKTTKDLEATLLEELQTFILELEDHNTELPSIRSSKDDDFEYPPNYYF